VNAVAMIARCAQRQPEEIAPEAIHVSSEVTPPTQNEYLPLGEEPRPDHAPLPDRL
jgi:hypothetical protein